MLDVCEPGRLPCPLVFLHIFKCGGTAITNPITHRLGADHSKLKVNTAAYKLPLEHLDEMRAVGAGARFITGHACDGSGVELMVRVAGRPTVLMTVVRNPIMRVFSTYHYLRMEKCSFHPLHAVFVKYPLPEVLENIGDDRFRLARGYLANHQVRAIAGSGYATYTDPALYTDASRSLLSLAEANLLHFFSYIGRQESINQDWPRLCGRFGLELPDPHYLEDSNRQNTTEYTESVTDRLAESISRANALDKKLYDWCVANAASVNSRPLRYVAYRRS